MTTLTGAKSICCQSHPMPWLINWKKIMEENSVLYEWGCTEEWLDSVFQGHGEFFFKG